MKHYSHQKLNLKADLINALMKDGEKRYGGKNNATVKSRYFRANIAMYVNRLLNFKL